MSFTLKDTFQTDLPTGINGTLCDTGQARTVVDNTGRLWFYNEVAYAQGGAGDLGDPGLWYPQQTSRILGQATFFHIRQNLTNATGTMVGWSTAQSGNTIVTGLYLRSDGLIHSVNTAATAGAAIGAYAANTDYYFCLVTRATGHYIFIKGGAWTSWTLLYYDYATNTANLYPAIEWASTNTGLYPYSYLFGIAGETVTPTILASDSFNRADGDLGNTDGAGDSELTGGSGLAWTTQTGTVGIASNAIKASAVTASKAIATVDCGSPSFYLAATCTAVTGGVGVIVKYIDINNYVRVAFTAEAGGYIRITEVIDGTGADTTGGTAYTGGGVLHVTVVGGVLRVYVNNAYQTGKTLDAKFAANNNVGFFTSNIANYIDNLVVLDNGNYDAVLNPYIALPSRPSVVLTNPLIGGGTAYKVQSHCHASGAPDDGTQTITDLITAYKAASFNAVVVTGHNVIHAAPDPPVADILYIVGVEETSTGTGTPHVGHLNAVADIASGTPQATITGINAEANAIAAVNHPNHPTIYFTAAQVVQLTGYKLLEIYNAYTESHSGAGKGDGTTKAKVALSRGKQIFLNAVDDCHDTLEGDSKAQFNRAWDVVNAASLSAANIIAAYNSGNFYPTQGPIITSVVVAGATITVNVPADCSFVWTAGKLGGSAVSADAGGTARASSYTCIGDEICVFCTVTRTADSLNAWTQPVWVETTELSLSPSASPSVSPSPTLLEENSTIVIFRRHGRR